MKKTITLSLILFTLAYGESPNDYEVHDIQLDEIVYLNDFLLQNYSEDYWCVEVKLTNQSQHQFIEWVKLRYNFWKEAQIVKTDYSYLEYDTYEDNGLMPMSMGLIQSMTEKTDFDSINFYIEYDKHDGTNLCLIDDALELMSTNFEDLSFSDTYSKWIGAVKNKVNTALKYPTIFACFFKAGKMIDLDYCFLDVSESMIEPGETGYFDTLIILPADYDSICYYTHYSIGLTGTVEVPVELSNFHARIHNNMIELEWTTESETNNYCFDIERKIDSANWKKISRIYGHGTSSETNTYKFNDKYFSKGIYYYRLRQIDYDGTATLSREISISVQKQPIGFTLSKNYPNPFNSNTTIAYTINEPSHVQLLLFDVRGKTIKKFVDKFQDQGKYQITVDLDEFPSGTYFYKLINRNGTATKSMSLIK